MSQPASVVENDLARVDPLARLKLVSAVVIVLLSWAGSYVAIGIAVQELSPASFALARVGGGALALIAMMPFVPGAQLRLPRRRNLPLIAAMAMMAFPIYQIAISTGQQVVSPGVSSVLIATLPIFATLIAVFTLKERPSAREWVGIAIAFLGVALLVTVREGRFALEPAALFVLLAAISGAGFMVVQRQLTRRYNSLELTLWGLWMGAIALLPFAPSLLAEMRGASSATWLSVVYVAVLPTALGYLLWAYVLKMLTAAKATSLLYIVPPIAFTLAWLITGQAPGGMDIISSVIVICGVALVQSRRRG